MKKTIYEFEYSCAVTYAVNHLDKYVHIPNKNPISYKEADEIICKAIVYEGRRITYTINHVMTHDMSYIDNLIVRKVFGVFDHFRSHNIRPDDINYQNLMRMVHNFRQRHWYWKPFNIIVDYSVYDLKFSM